MRRSPTPESVRCAARGTLFKGSPRSAFSLAELIVVLLLLTILSVCIAPALSSSYIDASSPERVRREADRAASWLQRVFHKALLSGRSFTLSPSSLRSRPNIVVQWTAPVEDEVFRGDGSAFFINNALESPRSFYVPKWNILTPALTIRVSDSEGPRRTAKPLWYIVVSPYGRVSLRDTPP